MTKPEQNAEPVKEIPYGADPMRGRGLLIVWGALYFAWFAALFWMAVFHTGL